jgi:hypothetical protein
LQKIVSILFLLVFLTGCSVSRKTELFSVSNLNSWDAENANSQLVKTNFTVKSFFVERADLEFVSDGEKQSLLASVKFEYPDKYLLSIRTKSGIEAARIFISGDTVLANDRINQIFYTGNSKYIESQFGLDYRFIGLLFGDVFFAQQKIPSATACNDNLRTIDLSVYGKNVRYIIDCRKNKATGTTITDSYNRNTVILKFDSFLKEGSSVHPSVITLNVPDRNIVIKIRLRKIDYNFESRIEFVPGAKYEKKLLQ